MGLGISAFGFVASISFCFFCGGGGGEPYLDANPGVSDSLEIVSGNNKQT